MTTEIELLRSAHQLFTVAARLPALDRSTAAAGIAPRGAGALVDAHRSARSDLAGVLVAARETDERLMQILLAARQDHSVAQRSTGDVLAAARADLANAAGPIAAREMIRRSAGRLRAQHAHVHAARRSALRRRVALRNLRYRTQSTEGNSGRAGTAVRAALSRLGRPYVWGAIGPDRFDCSGLVQWAYGQAGVHLRRTTYEQIRDGVPVGRAQVRPGDLVFPHTGHVQLAIGNGMVVEAPQPGALVQISRMGPSVAIRRPT